MSETPESPIQKKSFWDWKELLQLALIVFIIIVPLRLYVLQPFIVDGASMHPTFKNGQYLIVDELTYQFKDPERGSVLVFIYPKDRPCTEAFVIYTAKKLVGMDAKLCRSFIKRVVGLPGDIIIVRDGTVTIKSAEYPEGLTLDEPYVEMPKNDTLSFTLGQEEYFVMGDNRAQSADSRIWGAVPRSDVVGRPILRAYPFSFFPADFTNSYKE